MLNFDTPEAALKYAQETPDAGVYAFYLGYASGLTEAKRGNSINGFDRQLQTAKDDYARGYSAGFHHQNVLKGGA